MLLPSLAVMLFFWMKLWILGGGAIVVLAIIHWHLPALPCACPEDEVDVRFEAEDRIPDSD